MIIDARLLGLIKKTIILNVLQLMGSCNSKTIFNDTEGAAPLQITILGLPGVGKTSIVEYLAGEYNPQLRPITTSGVIVKNVVNKGDNFIFFDCGGKKYLADDWNHFISKSQAVIYVFDPLSILYCIYF
jgi:GTPase SAR1 family protein